MLLFFVVAAGVAVILAIYPMLRCAVCHPISLTYYGVKDAWNYIRHKQSNTLGTGELVAYTGLFGKGKTLSAVHRVTSNYRFYNGKPVWCPRRKKIVKQRVHVISNVSLNIPYEDFQSLEQIVLAAER